MMSKTHLAVGIGIALVFTRPQTVAECVIAVAGGALGGVTADIDSVDNDYKADALIGQLLALVVVVLSLFGDYVFDYGILSYISAHQVRTIVGCAIYLGLIVKGFTSNHRTFTHSLLATVLYSVTLCIVFPPVFYAYLFGYISHICLDLLNKKGLELFYPVKKGYCLKLCYASKTANTAFMIIGVIISVGMIVYSAIKICY